MSTKVGAATHDKLKECIGPIHEEIANLDSEMDRLRSERAILQVTVIAEIEKIGFSKEAIGHLSAACW